MTPLVEAARPKTLTAAIVPVFVGTAAATRFIPWRFFTALLLALALQVAVNYANDYFDGVGGIDGDARLGPRRAVASGLVTPARMKTAMIVALGIAVVAGIALAAATQWWLLAVGAVALLAAVGYSGGPAPYASFGFGELFVFVFFGLVATVGSGWVQDQTFSATLWLAGIGVGCFSVAIMVLNNLRDIPTDREAGKRTLAVALGDRWTRRLYLALVVIGLAVPAAIAVSRDSVAPLLAWVCTPLAFSATRRVLTGTTGRALVPVLGQTSLALMTYGLGLSAGVLGW